MAVLSPNTTPSYNVRSISFPARSHPTLQRLQENLSNLTSPPSNSPSPKAETVLARLSGLGDIYKCVDNLLQLPSTQQSLSQHQKLVSDMLDDLIRFLDICNNTKDSILALKESLRQVESSFRRSKAAGEDDQLRLEAEICGYFSSRKKMKKEAEKFLSSLKTKQTQIADDSSLDSVIKALKGTSWVTVSVFNSLLLFLSASISKPMSKKWPQLLSKLVGKESAAAVACESQQDNMNEVQKVEVELMNLSVSGKEKMECAQKMLESLDSRMEEFENGLECLFRHLIQTRVCLLNIVSNLQLE